MPTQPMAPSPQPQTIGAAYSTAPSPAIGKAPPPPPGAPPKPPVVAKSPAVAKPAPLAVPLPPTDGSDLDEPLHPVGFWQQSWVQNVLPLVTSVSIHAAIVITGLVFIQAVKVIQAPAHQDQTIIPDAEMVQDGPPGGVPNVGPGNDANRQAMQDQDPTAGTDKGWAEKQAVSVDITAKGGPGDDSAGVFDGGLSGGIGGKGKSSGTGTGDGGGPLARFGPPGGGAIGPRGPVFGHGGNARQIVFLCDGTGSMLNKMPALKDQLTLVVNKLTVVQSYDILFFQDNQINKLADTLITANPESKRRAGAFLEGVTATGTTNPIPALEMALKLRPQLLYFLTDAADFPDTKAVTDTINRLNADRKIKINTILFVEDKNEHEKNVESQSLMEGIAKDNGGRFRWVEMDSLQR